MNLSLNQAFFTNPHSSSIAQSKFFHPKAENTKMDIESPLVRGVGDNNKVSQSAGQTKKRKLSNKNLKLNSEGLCRKFDPFFDCFTPKLEETRVFSENSKKSLLNSKKIGEEFTVIEVFPLKKSNIFTFNVRLLEKGGSDMFSNASISWIKSSMLSKSWG